MHFILLYLLLLPIVADIDLKLVGWLLVGLKKEEVAKLQTKYIKENLNLMSCWNHDPSEFKQFMSKNQIFDISNKTSLFSNHSNITILSKI